MSAKSAPAGRSSSKGAGPRAATKKGATKKAPAVRRAPRGKKDEPGGAFRERQLANSRYGIVYDIDGPRVRLGVLWFLLCIVCLFLGLVPLTVLFAAVAGLAAAQTATVWRARWCRPDRAVAAGVAAALPLAAALGTALAGVVLIASAIGVVVHASVRPQKGSDALVNAGTVMRSALAVGVAAAAVVMLYRVDIGAAVTVILVVSAYESGDFLVGTGASNRIEGPASGILAALGMTAALAVWVPPPPFEGASLWFFGVLAALLAPAGQVLASAILPRAGAPARALRRLDSYLLVAPVWLVLMWAGLQS